MGIIEGQPTAKRKALHRPGQSPKRNSGGH